MLRHQKDGLVYYRFAHLAGLEAVVHGVFARQGGVSRPPFASLNVSEDVGDDPEAVARNRGHISQVLDFDLRRLVLAHQVHSDRVAIIKAAQTPPPADALLTDTPGLALMMHFADCVPILLCDPARRAVGLVHAGRKGTLKNIAAKAVQAMREFYGSRPEDILAGIGPAIGPCCYQVGEDVAEEARLALREFGGENPVLRRDDGSYYLNLWAANRAQLAAAGVREIELAGLCTACHTEEFFSHRAEGGRTGRFAVAIGIRVSHIAHRKSFNTR